MIVWFRRKILRRDIINMYKVKNLEKKNPVFKSVSWAQNFKQLEEGLYIHTYASQEHSGIYWVTRFPRKGMKSDL